MHSSPTLVNKTLFIKQNRMSLLIAGVISTAILMAGNIYFVLAHPGFLFYGLFIAVVAFYLFISYLVGFCGCEFNHKAHKDLVAKWFDKSAGAHVDIYLPVCGEPIEVLRNTWGAVAALLQSHENAVAYVLDDGKSDEVSTLAHQFQKRSRFQYIRRETNELKKAGNMRNAFKMTAGEYIVVFDADFCPRVDFLIETLPYFFEREKTGIVQTPQFFDVYPSNTWVQRGAGAIQELFYRLIQVNRDTFNGAICVGTNAVYRRKALEPFGGTALIEYSEDVHTGFQLITTGWRIQYIPVVLAEGLCPESLKQYFTQQYRWALGSISLFFARKFWRGPLSAMQRISYLSGMFFYMSTGLSVVFGPLPSLVMLIFFPDKIHWYNLLFSLPSLLFSTCFMWWWMKLPMGVDVLRVRHVSYFAHLSALKDYLLGTLEEWKPTGAKTSSARYQTFKVVYCAHTFGVPTLVLSLVAWRVTQGFDLANFSLLMAFTAYNAYVAMKVIDDL